VCPIMHSMENGKRMTSFAAKKKVKDDLIGPEG
jgi:hypothetical protein